MRMLCAWLVVWYSYDRKIDINNIFMKYYIRNEFLYILLYVTNQRYIKLISKKSWEKKIYITY